MSSKSNCASGNGSPSDFNKHLMETERAFKQMSLKNNLLDSTIEKLRRELEEKDEEYHEAYTNLLALEEDTEAEKAILLSLKTTVRQAASQGEELKKQIEAGHALLVTWEKKERDVVKKFEEDSALVIGKSQENDKINNSHEMAAKVCNMKQKLQETKEKRQQLQQTVEELKSELHRAKNNTGYEGLDEVYAGLPTLSKEELEEEEYYRSTLQKLMRLHYKKKRDFETILNA